MGWFRKAEEPECIKPPARLASAEFVSGLVELAELYERREAQARVSIRTKADELSHKQFFNYRELDDQYAHTIRGLALEAIRWSQLAAEVRNWVSQYENRGRCPPYMAAPGRIKPADRDNE